MTSQIIIFIIVFGISLPFSNSDNPCRFESNEGVIDLSSVGHTNGTAKYDNRKSSLQPVYNYSYNPCHPFIKGLACQNVAICQVNIDDPNEFVYNLGEHISAKWIGDIPASDNLTIMYRTIERVSFVYLNCSIDGREKFEILGEGPIRTYKFRLTHVCACWDACNNTLTTVTTTTTTSATSTSATTATTTSATTATTTSATTATTTSATTATTTSATTATTTSATTATTTSATTATTTSATTATTTSATTATTTSATTATTTTTNNGQNNFISRVLSAILLFLLTFL